MTCRRAQAAALKFVAEWPARRRNAVLASPPIKVQHMKTAPFALGAVVLAAALTLGVTAQSKSSRRPILTMGRLPCRLDSGAPVVADNLVVGKKSGNTAEKLRGIAVAPNGDIYAKTRLGQYLRAA